jgi:hypothetical protein
MLLKKWASASFSNKSGRNSKLAVMFGTLIASTKVSAYIERLGTRPAYIATHQV